MSSRDDAIARMKVDFQQWWTDAYGPEFASQLIERSAHLTAERMYDAAVTSGALVPREEVTRLETEAAEQNRRWSTSHEKARIDEYRRRTWEAEIELAAFHAECDKVGLPYDAAGLVRHHRGNAGLAAAAILDSLPPDLRRQVITALRQGEEAK